VEIFSFLAASFRGKKSFLTGETVSLVLLLFPHFISMPCHLFVEAASHLLKIETTINIPLGLPLGGKVFMGRENREFRHTASFLVYKA
jgi:hypothetical protein